ncbi:MAG: 4-hydroxy-tetrahydrodipicolinate synthase [Gammaproteobacteria bacterium]|nr:4-hydroxy-tetrahydrodipicolinate synthase [Gammaproteobacteria bacterium]
MYSGSFVALVTPMQADGSVDFSCLEKLIDWHVEQGTNGLVIVGTTGESPTLEHAEHARVVRHAAEYCDRRLPVLAGTGSNSTRQTIDLSLEVASAPIDGYLVVTPYYNKPTQDGLVLHFQAIADAVDQPIMLYNVPGRTAVDLQPETVARLAEHPRIFAIKEATGEVDRVNVLRELCGEDFDLFSGDDPSARQFMLAGGQGVVSVTANVAPAAFAAMCEAAVAGDRSRAEELDAPLAGLHRDLFIEANPIPVKWALERMGLIPPGIRLPLTRLSAAARPAVEEALQQAGVL